MLEDTLPDLSAVVMVFDDEHVDPAQVREAGPDHQGRRPRQDLQPWPRYLPMRAPRHDRLTLYEERCPA